MFSVLCNSALPRRPKIYFASSVSFPTKLNFRKSFLSLDLSNDAKLMNCVRIRDATTGMDGVEQAELFGGKYLFDYKYLSTNLNFQEELKGILKNYAGRESPLYFAERLTEHHKSPIGGGPHIYLYMDDLIHTGPHKINNAVSQTLVAKYLGKKRVIAETGAAEHGVATATVCARFGLECIIYMDAEDMDRQSLNVLRMSLLGAEVRPVCSGTATSEAIKDWVTNEESTHYILGSVDEPHPYPMMPREFHAVIRNETRKQAFEKWGGKPDVLVAACVGGGSNAMGLFHEFVDDKEVRLICVEAASYGLNTSKHASATMTDGEANVLKDEDVQTSARLDYHGVGTEHSFLKDTGGIEYYSVTTDKAIEARNRLYGLEGIIPTLETSQGLAYLEKLCPTLSDGTKVVLMLNCNRSGD